MILLDLDNILADFETYFRELINELTGRRAQREDITSFWIVRKLELSAAEEERVWNEFLAREGWSRLPYIPGSAEFVRELRTIDRVAIVTNREAARHEVSAEWLARHGIAYDELHVSERPSKLILVRELGWMPRVVIEDAGHHVAEFAAAGVPVVLFDYPWNRDSEPPGVTRVHDFAEALTVVRRIYS